MPVDTLTKTQWVYSFGGGGADGDAKMKNLLGGKGANLAEMSSLGLPVPPGFTVTTEACVHYYANGKQYPAELKAQLDAGLATVEKLTGKSFGDVANPLLVSVRSGARASMPGMMDTVLNLGLNDETVEGLAILSGDRRFAYDSYRRFIQMYSNVVLDLEHHMFEEILDDHKDRLDVTVDTALSADDWAAHRDAIMASLSPMGALEAELAERVAVCDLEIADRGLENLCLGGKCSGHLELHFLREALTARGLPIEQQSPGAGPYPLRLGRPAADVACLPALLDRVLRRAD